MDTLGNFSEYMSMANDYGSCIEGESLYYSMNGTILNTPENNNSQEGHITLGDLDATKIGDTTLQHENVENVPPIELKINQTENFMSSTPNKLAPITTCEKLFDISTVNNKSVDGFLEVSKMLRLISTKLNAVQNKENVNTNKKMIKPEPSKLSGVKIMKTNTNLSLKPIIKVTAQDVRNNLTSDKLTDKLYKQVIPATSTVNHKRMSMKTGSINPGQTAIVRKSLIPPKFEIKNKTKLTPNNKLPTKEPTKKEFLVRKSIIPTSSRSISTALKVSTKPRKSVLNRQKSFRRSIEKLNEAVNQMRSNLETTEPCASTSNVQKTSKVQKTSNLETSEPRASTLNVQKTLNIGQSVGKLSVAFSQELKSPQPKPSKSTTSNHIGLNLRRSIAKFKETINQEIPNFECMKCNRKFRMESNYLTHMNSHTDSSASNLVCKYCDKKFQLRGALQTHLRDYCTKIPLKEKRLLDTNAKIQMTPLTKNNSKPNSIDSISKLSNGSSSSVTSDSSSMKPRELLSVLMYKESNKVLKTLHSGISRTPKKINMCQKCGKMFYNLFTLQAHKTCIESDDETDRNHKD